MSDLPTNPVMTPDELKQAAKVAVKAAGALAEYIRAKREIPDGELYAAVMSRISLDNYTWCIQRLIGAGLVSKSANVLRWIGP
jgi:hypothetical protein